MSKVSIEGNALGTGTFTIAAPNSNTSYTLTLPENTGTVVTTGGASSLTTSGDLTFTGTGNRITGDFSNATAANRVAFQTSTTNSATRITFLPNGTGTDTALNIYNTSDQTNNSFGQFIIDSTGVVAIKSNISGTGSYLPMTFYTGGSERMRIDTSGNLLVGTTSTGGGKCVIEDTSANQLVLSNKDTGSASQYACYFLRNNSIVGSIQTTNTATSYVTSSDYRLKHDIQPMTGALAKVQQLKPVTYKWNADDSQSQGFIAHELQEVVPDCVTGEKDAVDADGNPVYQGVDYGKITPLLTAALQEAIAEIQSLKARVAELEAK